MSSLPPGLLEVQRKLLQTIEDLRQEFLARTDELTIVISAMDQFGSMTVDQLSLTDPLDEGSVLDLGLRFIPEDYKAAISANKTSAAPIFAEKKRASISGRTSVGANGGGAGVGGRRRSSAVTTVLQAAGIRRSVTKSASSLQKKSLASIARSTSSKEKISSPSELDEPTIPKMGTDDSDFEAVERGGLTLSAHQPTGHSVISIHTNDVYELNASALKMSSRDHSRLGNTVPSASSLSADWAIASRESMKSSGLKLPISTVSQNSSKKENKDMDDGDDGLGTFGLKLPFGTVSKPERQKKIGEQAADVGKLGLKLPPSHAMEESDQLGGLKLPPAKAGQHRRKSYDLLEVSSLNNSHNSISSNSTRQSGSRMPSEISAAGQRRRSSTTPPVVEDSRNSSGKAKWSVIKATIALSAMARSSVKPAAQQISPTTPGPAKGFSVTREGHRDFAPQLSQENNVVGRKEESVAVVVPTVLKDDEEDSILEKRLASKQKTAVMSEMEVEGDEDRLGSIKPRRVPNKTNKVPGTPTAPKLTIKEEFQHHHFVLNFLIPVFDNKGRVVDLDQFDRADIADAAFSVCGLHPRSLFSSYWDFVMTILYLLMLWLLPFSICFTITDFDSPNSRGISDELSTVCSVIYTVVFLADSLISLITPQALEVYTMASFRDYEMSRPTIQEWAVIWMKKYLVIHIISLVPWDLIFMNQHWHTYLQLFRFFRLYRIANKIKRCAIYKQLFVYLDNKYGSAVGDVLPILCIIFFVVHTNACLMYLIGKYKGFPGWDDPWKQFHDATIGDLYAWTFYMTVGNMLPMSFMARSTPEIVRTMFTMMIGSSMFAVLIGSISAATLSYDSSGRLYHQKMDELKDYMKWKNVSEETRQRLIAYYETKYRGKYFEEESLLADMNESLRTEVSLHNTRRLIEQVPFLRRIENDGRDEIFYGRIAAALHACYFTPGDCITKQGDSGLDMFFIQQGKVNVIINDVKVTSLYDDAYIGEVALVTKALRTATIQAAMPSVLYRLTAVDFQQILRDFPDMKTKIDNLARNGGKTLDKMKKLSGM